MQKTLVQPLVQADVSLRREMSPRCGTSLNTRNLRLRWQGKAYTNTFLTPELMKKDLETFTALLEFIL